MAGHDIAGASPSMMHRRRLLTAASLFVGVAAVVNTAARAGWSGLTTHMLDVTSGKPAEGVHIDFSVADGVAYRFICSVVTNADGCSAERLLTPETMKVGQYQLVFHIADYFSRIGTILAKPPFLDKAVVQFGISDATSHYHVPLLASPWSYTTYRGS